MGSNMRNYRQNYFNSAKNAIITVQYIMVYVIFKFKTLGARRICLAGE